MKTYFISILLIAFAVKSYGQKDSLWNLEGVSNITVYLRQKINETTSTGGSATVIKHNGNFFLLTAEHVAKSMKNDAIVIFRASGDKPAYISLLTLSKNKKIDWKIHPTADLAIIQLSTENKDVALRLSEWSFPSSQIYSEKNLPSKDADLTFLGYPRIDLNMEHFSPLTFNSHLASGLITQLRYDTNTSCNFFYLDIPSMQGCSGSAVYYSVQKGYFFGGKVTYIVGVVHGTAIDNSGGKLATITPSYYIWDLLK